ncbi:hypothetical protein C8R45DRAFT_1188547 [Mycena sanguinolenta]|nr:hypothetical protein C8R45DRAFT_1188547 [Mycena sanguinolenta]
MQADLVNQCLTRLTEKFPSLVDMIQTLDRRSLLCAALSICLAQTFIDGSAKALEFAAVFAAALDAYVGSSTEAAVVADIRKITNSTPRTNTSTSSWFPQPAWLNKRKDQKRKESDEREREEREAKENRFWLISSRHIACASMKKRRPKWKGQTLFDFAPPADGSRSCYLLCGDEGTRGNIV